MTQMTGSSTINGCQLYGRDHVTYGDIAYCNAGESVACAICIGSDPDSPSLVFKGDKDTANEDALLACAGAGRITMAVADSHFGLWASHAIIEALYENHRKLVSFESIYRVFMDICHTKYNYKENSETTLALVSVDTATGNGIGVSFGDSSVMLINAAGIARLNIKNGGYVSPNKALSLDTALADEFEFTTNKGDMLVLFTDGVDECHYGYTETSVQDHHIHQLYREHAGSPVKFAAELARLSLAGVDGNPGGQDNLAITVALM